MINTIATILQRECRLDIRNLLLIGVSGGPDSLCLLHSLHVLGYHIIAAHVNHGLRPEADEELQVVKEFSNQLGVNFISSKVDVQSYASDFSISIEEAARTLRYQFLFEQAHIIGASAVLVGHNADDQVETILMHFLRGSGLTGLRGMEYCTVPNPWSEHIPLVRPLLSTWRENIMIYLAEHKLTPLSDPSNFDRIYFRNRLRHELLPILEGFNPRIRENLLRLGQIMSDDYSVLEYLTNEAWECNLIIQGEGYLAFHLTGFLKLSPSIQRYLLRKAIAYHLPGLRDVDFDCIERGLGFLLDEKPNTQTDLIAGLRILKEGDLFWLASWQANLPMSDFPVIMKGVERIVEIPSTLCLNGNWKLQTVEVVDKEAANQQRVTNPDPFQAWLDASDLKLPLIIRSRKAGDRILPLGMNGHSMKVSDLMINLKLPKRARPTWPLICSGNNVLWIPGYRLSHLAQIKPESSLIIHFKLSNC